MMRSFLNAKTNLCIDTEILTRSNDLHMTKFIKFGSSGWP